MFSLDYALGVRNFPVEFSTQQLSGTLKSETLPEQIRRIKKSELEAAYIKDPVLFNGVNLIVKTFLGAGFKIESKDPEVEAFMETFGKKYNMISIVLDIIKDICVYGDAWLELLYNKQGTRIIGIDRIDPKTMDIDKDYNDKPMLDSYGKPRRFFQKVPAYLTNKQLEFNSKGETGIFFEPDEIAHFKLYTVGDSLNGIGLIEPLFTISYQKLQIQQGYANSVYRTGFPIAVGQIGDDNHEATPEQIQTVKNDLANMNSLSVLVYPYYYNVKFESPKNVEKLKEHLTYFTEQEIAGLGIPKPFVMGTGEDTNRAILQYQASMFEKTIKLIQKVVTDTFREQIFGRMGTMHNWSTLPDFHWMDANVEDMEGRAARLVQYAQAGLLIPDKSVRADIRRREELPEEETGTPTPKESPAQELTKKVEKLSSQVSALSEGFK